MTYNLPIDTFTALESAFGDRDKAEKVAKSIESAIRLLQSSTNESMEEKSKELATKSDLQVALAETKADLLKWMFIFWAGQVVAVVAILKSFIH